MTLLQTTTMAKVGCDGTDGQRLRLRHLPGVRQCSDNRDRGIWFGDLKIGIGMEKGLGKTRLETALSVGLTSTMDLGG